MLDPEVLWKEALEDVVTVVESPVQRQWLQATRPVGFSEDTVVLATPHSFAREWLDTRCGERIRTALAAAAGRELTVVITVQPNPEPLGTVPGPEAVTAGEPPAMTMAAPPTIDPTIDLPPPITAPPPADPVGAGLEAPGRPPGPTIHLPEPRPAENPEVDEATQLNPKYIFDNFVIGTSNRFAHAAAFAVAEAPAKAYNPLFIYGDAGLGKTHLLHAIGHYVRSLYPRLKVRYVTTEQFTNEFISAIQTQSNSGFQRQYRQTDVLLIDDIQFLERAERTQEEFFHTFNALHNAEKQIVISSDRPPKKIARLEDRLRSRFEWGLMVDVQPPELETRIAILRKKAEAEDLPVPPDCLEFIASKVQSNIRELEGALLRVTAFASLQRSPVDIQLAEMVLKDLFPDDREQEIGVQLIMDTVSEYFQLTIEDLCSPSRSRNLVTARQIAMYLVRELTDLSLPKIGKAFGGRDHTTVMHANTKISGLMAERRNVYDQVQELTNRIKTRARAA